jgi:hypothetical protein
MSTIHDRGGHSATVNDVSHQLNSLRTHDQHLDEDGVLEDETTERSPPIGEEDDEDIGSGSFFVQAQYEFKSTDDSSLSFVKDDVIEVLTQLPSGWWDGLLGLSRGWFPSNYVKRIEPWEAEAWFLKQAEQEDEDNEFERDGAGLRREEDEEEEDVTLTGTHLYPHPQQNSHPDPNGMDSEQTDGRIRDRRSFAANYAMTDSPLPDDSPTESGVMHDNLSSDHGSNSQASRKSGERLGMDRDSVEDIDEVQQGGDGEGNAEDFWVPSMTQDGQVSLNEPVSGRRLSAANEWLAIRN